MAWSHPNRYRWISYVCVCSVFVLEPDISEETDRGVKGGEYGALFDLLYFEEKVAKSRQASYFQTYHSSKSYSIHIDEVMQS